MMFTAPKTFMVVYGTRPSIIKLSPVVGELRRRAMPVTVVSTGQHLELAAQAEEDTGLYPDIRLDAMRHGQSLSQLTSRLLFDVGEVIADRKPECVIVVGDTVSGLAGALAGFYSGARVAHVEAGLRSWNSRDPFPEECNRRCIDVLSDFLFAPTHEAAVTCASECHTARVWCVGNTVVDSLRAMAARVEPIKGITRPLILVTAHRRENWGEPINQIADACARLGAVGYSVVWPLHANPSIAGPVRRRLEGKPNVTLCDAMSYRDFVRHLVSCDLVLTDSGGVQEEAATLRKPTLILRMTTERPEGVKAGIAEQVGTDAEAIFSTAADWLNNYERRIGRVIGRDWYGDGRAAQRIVDVLTTGTTEEWQHAG